MTIAWPDAIRLCLLGTVGYVALHQLWLWRKSPEDRTYAWSAAWLAVAALLVVGRIIQHTATTASSGTVGTKLLLTGAMLVGPVLIGGMYAVADRAWSRPARALFVTLVVTVLLILLTDVFDGVRARPIRDAMGARVWVATGGKGVEMIALLAYFAAAGAWAVRSILAARAFVDRRGRWTLALAAAAAGVAAINDGLLSRGAVSTIQLADYGCAVVAIAVSYVHVRRSALYLSDLERRGRLRGALLERVIDAQEQERRRIARDLHDATAQSLTSISVRLSTLEQDPRADGVRSSVSELRDLAKATLHEVREIAAGLHPSVLDDLGFDAAIHNYAEHFSRTHDVEVDIHMNGVQAFGRMPHAIELVLYRIAQEALSNVAKHAAATTVSILVDRNPDSVRMILEDDGRGFDIDAAELAAADRQSIGLHSVRERAALVGGTATFESSPGAGTTLYVQLPIPS